MVTTRAVSHRPMFWLNDLAFLNLRLACVPRGIGRGDGRGPENENVGVHCVVDKGSGAHAYPTRQVLAVIQRAGEGQHGTGARTCLAC